MNTQRRPKNHPRPGGIWVVLAFLLIIGGTIMTLRINNHAAPLNEQSESTPSPQVSSSPSASPVNRIKIVIDAGHGGIDPGADGVSGIQEKTYTLSLSAKIYELLQRDAMFQPYMTRTDDQFVDLIDRAVFANDLHADALLSIHANFFKDAQVSGTETYYYSDNSSRLAEVIHAKIVSAMGFQDREVRKRELKVLAHSEMPAALLEIGYLTNRDDEAAMLSHDGQTRAAQAIVDGLKQYFSESK